jgi:pyrroline-5-carboxylate reductase
MLTEKRIFFLGAGSISEAIIKGLVEARVLPAQQIIISNRKQKDRLRELSVRYGVQASAHKLADMAEADMVILAVKPFDLVAALQEVRGAIAQQQLVVSVVAGASTAAIEAQLAERVPVIRTMPNTSSFVQESATAISGGTWATEEQLRQVEQVFSAIGSVSVVDERLLDAVTGLSGSGPAYIYYVVEALMKAGQELELPEDICRTLLVQTVYGAAKMLRETGTDPQELRRRVTSPNGTTMAGIAALEQGGLQDLFQSAVRRATERAAEMGRQFS